MLFDVLQMTLNNTNPFGKNYAHLTLKSQMCISGKFETFNPFIYLIKAKQLKLVMATCSPKPRLQLHVLYIP